MRRDDKGKLKAVVGGPPEVYAIYEKRAINGHDHVQLTYTAWYPAHPRMKMIDLEEADIDSCVVRVTLDADHCPLFYETIAACGCFHKVFVERWLEDGAAQSFGAPEKGKKYGVERTLKDSIDWEVAGVIDEPRDRPRRPVVFIKAGDHKVLGMGSAARLRVPPAADARPYELADYAELYSLPVAGEHGPGAVLRPGAGRQGVRSGAQGALHLLLHRRRWRRPAAGARPDQAALRPEHLERPDHLREVPAPAAGDAVITDSRKGRLTCRWPIRCSSCGG